MKIFKYILLFLISMYTNAQTTYYCSPRGSDINNGLDSSSTGAFGTWQYGINQLSTAGDTLYLLDGIWYPSEDVYAVVNYDPINFNGANGTYNNHIVVIGYPGQRPILDCSQNYAPGGTCAGLRVRNTTYVEFTNFEIRNNYSRPTVEGGISTDDINYADNGTVWFENIAMHDGGGVGFRAVNVDTLYLINCDSYNRCDSLDLASPGGDADGFLLSSGYAPGEGDFSYIEVNGCRAWNNADDGIDLATSKQFYVVNSWSFFNGIFYRGGYAGDGTGIKTSGGSVEDVTKRQIHNCVLTYNISDGSGGGVSELNLYSPAAPYMELYNNTIYKNYQGYNSSVSGGNWNYDVDSGSVVSANNLIYEYTATPVGYSERLTSLGAYDPPYSYTTTTTDSWDWVDPPNHWYNRYNPLFTITDDDFTSLDSTTIYSQLRQDRNEDGDLPAITVLKLVEGSDLIDAGTNVGLSYTGTAPDIGAFESALTPSVKPAGNGNKVYGGGNKLYEF